METPNSKLKKLINAIMAVFHKSPDSIFSSSSKKEEVIIRQIFFYLFTQHLKNEMSYKDLIINIRQYRKKRFTHSTIISANKKIEEALTHNVELQIKTEKVELLFLKEIGEIEDVSSSKLYDLFMQYKELGQPLDVLCQRHGVKRHQLKKYIEKAV